MPVGLLALARPAGALWSERDRTTAAHVGSQIAAGIERARWSEQAAEAEARQAVVTMKEEFVSHVSHELRGPLTFVMGGAELIGRGRVNEAGVRELASQMHD